ncbi:B12-binding domain-containing radical SAM protein [Thioalbus denitrificans]|uniref:Radical SAM superfamily enzyme YgiQ (UPF0313 family) n=1 Tax=Thioalbus denitrificans TaxID=547122 RepID=A0A369CDZ8_9GAMM|nr:radical SAM protein [Thioalbus denitrificans]RCX31791.1 radical SAM superfamily enzyme YgiQ (UPF0313 family) [Thioalbus denitrificans]
MDITLLIPPVFDPTHPDPALPPLIAAINTGGHRAHGVDMNLATLTRVLDHDWLERKLGELDRKCDAESSSELRERRELCGLLLPKLRETLPAALGALRHPDTYRDPLGLDYRSSLEVIDNAFFILSSCHHPSRWSLTRFRSAHDLERSDGLALALTDRRTNPFDETVRVFLDSDPERGHLVRAEAFGIVISRPDQLLPGLTLALQLKARWPARSIILAGRHVEQIGRVLAGSEVLSGLADYLILGDGEIAFPRLLDTLGNGWRSATRERPAIIDERLEHPERKLLAASLPAPDCVDFAGRPYLVPQPVAMLQPTRGCYWRKCAFCSTSPGHGWHYLERPVERVLEDMEQLERTLDTRRFYFNVDNIAPLHLRRLAEALAVRKPGIEWSTRLFFEPTLADSALVGLLAESGCRQARFGLESASPGLRKRMRRSGDPVLVERVIKLFARHGIRVHLDWMVGFPGETGHDFQATVEFLRRNRDAVHTVNVSTFRLETGSMVFREPARFGIEIVDDPLRDLALEHAHHTGHGLSPQAAAKHARRAREFVETLFGGSSGDGLPLHDFLAATYRGIPASVERVAPGKVFRLCGDVQSIRSRVDADLLYLCCERSARIFRLTPAQLELLRAGSGPSHRLPAALLHELRQAGFLESADASVRRSA